MAAHRTGTSTAERLVCDVHYLNSVIDSHHSLRVKLLAVNAAAQLMGDIRDRETARSLCVPATGLQECKLSEDDKTQLELCRAQLLYYSGQHEAALEAVTNLASFFRVKGIVNSRLSRVYCGLGALSCFQGRYDQAKADFEAAYSVAARIGNEPQQAAAAANLEVCCLRLGEYREQLEWSSLANARDPFSGYQVIQAAYYYSFALAMLGRVTEALQVLDLRHAAIHEASPAWLVQAWRLHRADILYLCDNRAEALALGRTAVGQPPTLYSTSFAGPFARWLALVSSRDEATLESRAVLEELLSRRDELDMLDRAEVVCGCLMVEERGRLDLESMLKSYLVGLPYAVTTQLQRLGMLQADLCAAHLPKAGGRPRNFL
jgi:tetratricopeptide (TPR) repeat protein